jgi:hypothetical protein
VDLCRSYRTQERLDSLARAVATRNMWAAQRIHSRTLGCSWFADAGVARVDLVVNWESTGRTQYWLSGTAELTEHGARWTPGAASASLEQVNKDWEDTKFWLGLGAIAIGAIAAASAAGDDAPASGGGTAPVASARSGSSVACVWNRSSTHLRFQRRWDDASAWVRDSLGAGEGVRYTSGSSDTLRVRLDVGMYDDVVTSRTYRLAAERRAPDRPGCDGAASYDMVIRADTVRITSRPR